MHGPSVGGRLFLALQYLLPHHAVSALVYRATRWRWRPWKNFLIRFVIRRFAVDLDEAENSDLDHYPSLNAFFTRALRPGARPLARDGVACPADGVISNCGTIDSGRLIQAKGHDYTVAEILGGDQDLADRFDGGRFATIYLSPRDYHRVHMPLAGRLVKTIYIPGRLFSVAPITVENIPRLFARNERIACVFEGDGRRWVQVLVGAINVSAMETVWQGEVPGDRTVRVETDARELAFDRGAEMGRFNMGSTVIVLLPPGLAEWDAGLAPGVAVRVGQRLGPLASPTPGAS